MYIQQPLRSNGEQPDAFSNQLDVIQYPHLTTWRPFVSTSASRTPTLNNDRELSMFYSLDYPFGRSGFVLVACNMKCISSCFVYELRVDCIERKITKIFTTFSLRELYHKTLPFFNILLFCFGLVFGFVPVACHLKCT